MTDNGSTPIEGKAGNRHSRKDYKMLQDIHDHAVSLGAMCAESEGGKKGLSLSEKERRYTEVWREQFAPKNDEGEYTDPWPWVRDIFEDDGYLVVAWGPDLLRYDFALINSEIVFGSEAQPVEVVYRPKMGQAEPMGQMEPMKGNALKAIAMTDDTLTVGNYLALWGGRDLEGLLTRRKNADGSRGEYFTKATQFDSDYTESDSVIVDWEHGRLPDGVGPGTDEPLGRVNWKTARVDDRGLFVERVLNRRNKYVRLLEDLITAGMIGTSSEPIQGATQKTADGQITAWPLKRDTLTVTPMEPRMMTENQLLSLKALADFEPAIKSAYQQCGIDFPCDDQGAEAGGPACQEKQGKVKAALARLKSKQISLEYRL